MSSRAVVVEADGGSRGNPGPAAYGAVLLDAETRQVIAEREHGTTDDEDSGRYQPARPSLRLTPV